MAGNLGPRPQADPSSVLIRHRERRVVGVIGAAQLPLAYGPVPAVLQRWHMFIGGIPVLAGVPIPQEDHLRLDGVVAGVVARLPAVGRRPVLLVVCLLVPALLWPARDVPLLGEQVRAQIFLEDPTLGRP